jgi:hypothetical protein
MSARDTVFIRPAAYFLVNGETPEKGITHTRGAGIDGSSMRPSKPEDYEMAVWVRTAKRIHEPVIFLSGAFHLNGHRVSGFLRDDDVHTLLVAECEVGCEPEAVQAGQDIELRGEICVVCAASSLFRFRLTHSLAPASGAGQAGERCLLGRRGAACKFGPDLLYDAND